MATSGCMAQDERGGRFLGAFKPQSSRTRHLRCANDILTQGTRSPHSTASEICSGPLEKNWRSHTRSRRTSTSIHHRHPPQILASNWRQHAEVSRVYQRKRASSHGKGNKSSGWRRPVPYQVSELVADVRSPSPPTYAALAIATHVSGRTVLIHRSDSDLLIMCDCHVRLHRIIFRPRQHIARRIHSQVAVRCRAAARHTLKSSWYLMSPSETRQSLSSTRCCSAKRRHRSLEPTSGQDSCTWSSSSSSISKA